MKISSPADSPEISVNESLSMRSGRILSGQPRTKQYFDWGYVNWLVEPDEQAGERMSSGEVTVYPLCGEPEHTHFGEEQMIYVIAGQGTQTINGQSSMMSMGETFYLPPNCRHSLNNNFNEDLRLLCVYNHRRTAPSDLRPEDPGGDPEAGVPDLSALIDPEITQRMMDNISQSLELSLNLYDPSGRLILASGRQSPFCRTMVGRGEHCRLHIQKAFQRADFSSSSDFFHCCGYVDCLIIPLVCGREVCGYLKCGEFYISPDDHGSMEHYVRDQLGFSQGDEAARLLAGIKVEKRNRLCGAADSASALARYIVESGLAALRRKELDESRLTIINEKMAKTTLERALREADFKLLNSQINPHFLFNTLSIISQMAYMEGANKAVDLVCSLAELTRATLRKANNQVTLAEECGLLNDYLQIQKIRFGQRLEVIFEVEPGLESFSLPILTLQPLVENAITHGLAEPKQAGLRVEIQIRRIESGRILISVRDNGAGFPKEEIFWRGGVGLKSVEARLRQCFNDCFSLQIDSQPGRGTSVEIIIMEQVCEPGEQ